MITEPSNRHASLSRSSSSASNSKGRLTHKRSLCLPSPNQPLHVPIPPSLLQSPYLNSPQSMFQRTVSAPRLPSEQDEQWLQDTVPISGQIRVGSLGSNEDDCASLQNPGHRRYGPQRRISAGSPCSSTASSNPSPSSPASRLPASSGTGFPAMTSPATPYSSRSAGASFTCSSHAHPPGRCTLSTSHGSGSAGLGGIGNGIPRGVAVGGLEIEQTAKEHSLIPSSPPLPRWHKVCSGPMSPSPWLGHSCSRSDSSVIASAETSYFSSS